MNTWAGTVTFRGPRYARPPIAVRVNAKRPGSAAARAVRQATVGMRMGTRIEQVCLSLTVVARSVDRVSAPTGYEWAFDVMTRRRTPHLLKLFDMSRRTPCGMTIPEPIEATSAPQALRKACPRCVALTTPKEPTP